jgi:hypothetical protein
MNVHTKNKRRLGAVILATLLLFAGCRDLFQDDPGGDGSGKTPVPASSLLEALAWLRVNAVSGGSYIITLSAGEFISPQTLSFNGKSVSLTVRGDAQEQTVWLSGSGSLFTLESGITLTLDNNVTLRGG